MTSTSSSGTSDTDAPILLDWGAGPALDAFETLMWRLDAFPNLRSPVVGLELLDTAPDRERVRAAHVAGLGVIQRLRQRLVEVPLATPEWVEDRPIELDQHLSFVTLPSPGTMRQLLDVAQQFAMEPFDAWRPPWAARVVDGLEGGRAAYLLKLHHAMSDGIGIVQLLSALHSRQREPRAPRGTPTPIPATAHHTDLTGLARLSRRLRRAVKEAPRLVGGAVQSARHVLHPDAHDGADLRSRALAYLASLRRVLAPEMAAPSPLLARRSHDWHFEVLDFPLAPFKAAAKACQATLNDAFIAGLLGGLARYHRHFGIDVDAIPLGLPISMRKAGDSAGGNRFAPGQLVGRLGQATPLERMRHIGEQVQRLRQEPALAAPLAVMPVLARLPAPLVAKAMGPKMAANDLQASNVPGIRETVYFAGAQVTHLFPFAPLPGVPAMITLISHGPTCCVGLNLDSGAIEHPEVLMRGMRESFDEILALGA